MLRFLLIIILIGTSPMAYAYIDPGTGAYFIQAILALLASVIFYIKNPKIFLKDFIKKFLRRSKKK